jgi:uncharacterized protein
MPCLSSRIPHGELVTGDKLRMIEAAENLLRDAGFRDVRVRHHELSMGALARIEVGREEITRLTGSGRDARLTDAIRALGYSQVRVDPLGYRRGSLNAIDGERLLHPSERSGT